MFSFPDGSFKSFESYTVKFSAKETKWTSFEVRTHPILLENLISKYDIGPVKLPGLSRNGPLDTTNVARAGKRGNICVGNNVSATMCPRLPGP